MPEINKNKELTGQEYSEYFAERRKEKGDDTILSNQIKRSKLYETAAKFLEGSKGVIELGCGDGILTRFLPDDVNYIGIDFARSQIEAARKKYPNKHFTLADIKGWHWQSNKHSFVLLEVLEHIKDDLDVLKTIPKGARVVFSVPDLQSPSHVRYFKSFDEIYKRYGKLLEFEDKVEFTTQGGSVDRIVKARRK